MAVSLHELLQPQVILGVVSRIREKQNRLGKWLGFQSERFDPKQVSISGRNTVNGPCRYATFRIFDNTRVVAKARAPQTGPATIAPNPVGDVRVAISRWHQKIPLFYEDLGNLSPLAGPNSVIDPGGQNYIQMQIGHIAQQFNNAVEIMSAGMMRDDLYFVQQGDNWIAQLGAPAATAVSFQVPFQIPSGNKSQGNMLGTGNVISGSWASANTAIIQNLMALKAAFAQLSGYPVRHVWINSPMWYNVVSNTEVRNLAGSANTPFSEYDFVPEQGYDGIQVSDYTATLRADPTVIWHITDDVLVTGNTDIDPSYSTAPAAASLQKEIPDTMAIFCTDVSPQWTQLCYGGEYVVEQPGQAATQRNGYYFWSEYKTQPSAVELIGLLNAIPLLYIPKIIAPLTVVFGS